MNKIASNIDRLTSRSNENKLLDSVREGGINKMSCKLHKIIVSVDGSLLLGEGLFKSVLYVIS